MALQILLFIVFLFLPVQAGAANSAAVSCSYPDVLSAYNAASAGDTVSIPSGSCSWSSTLTISKSITLQGAGSGSTVLTANTSPLVRISLSSDVPVRVTGIGFTLGAMNNGRQAIQVNGNRTNSFALTQMRLDHLAITGGTSTIFLDGRIWGLIDHVTFTNAYSGVFYRGDDNYSWTQAFAFGEVQAGAAKAQFIEDCTFLLNNSSVSVVDAQIYIQEGAIVVSRYNTFDSTAFTSPGFLTLALNDHGNQEYIPPLGTNFRGQPIMEFYNNVARGYIVNGSFIGIRGNSSLIFNNTFTTVAGSPVAIQLSEEEAWQTAFFNPLRTVWPAQDQVRNTFIWNNMLNGAPIADITLDDPQAANAIFIQRNRDYFMHAPQATGGKATYTGRPGGSTTAPTTADTGTLTFSSSGPNAYYPYTPYPYPHPLQGMGSPAGPTSLEVR